MKFLTSPLRKWALVSICATAVGVGIGAGGATVARQFIVEGPAATQIIHLAGGNTKFDSNIARFDSSTGAVYRFRGDIDNPGVRNTWELRVPAVSGSTSGLLEIQRISLPNAAHSQDSSQSRLATFLVDVVTGRTWILRHRASSNATWDPVDVYSG